MSLVTQHAVRIAADGVELQADLRVPEDASAIVLFAHRSGTSRFSPRNRQVAQFLNQHRLATLLLDLLTAEEGNLGPVSEIHFDIGLLARRLTAASDWVAQHPATKDLPQGYFGASTTAAALIGAATRAQHIRAVVSRGGRADLAGDALPAVRAPTLLIVGGEDPHVLALNRLALAKMCCQHELVIVPGATRLFGEPGALDEVARLARAWFLRFLVPAPQPA
jgi:putative phosphoribosyl transferase